MNRNDIILWFGRVATIVFTAAVVYDIYGDATLSREIRAAVLGIVTCVFFALAAWQGYIARKYDGWPVIPLSFRWVVATWFGALSLFIVWQMAVTFWPEMYTDRRSAILWWQFGAATIWFASRWVTVETPHTAGIGETGSTPGNGNGGGA